MIVDFSKRSKEMQYELFYGTGGHGGPYKDLITAKDAAARMLAGNKNEYKVDVRPRGSPHGYGSPVARALRRKPDDAIVIVDLVG
jgi:hypothetical protein